MWTIREILDATAGQLVALPIGRQTAAPGLVAGNLNDHISGVSIDSRAIKEGDIFICIRGERFDGHDFIPEAIKNGAAAICFCRDKAVISGSKIPRNAIAVRNTITALSGLARYHRKRFSIPLVGITGTNGKTTAKEMLASILSSKYKVLKNQGTQNNIIGLSLALLRLDTSHEIAVLELGTNHFGEIAELCRISAPTVGLITNIGPAHLEFFGDENGVLREKWELIKRLAFPRIGILNVDDIRLKEKLSRAAGVNFFTFGLAHKADFMAERILQKDRKISFYIKNYPIELKTVSEVNVYNALSAYAAARIFSIDANDIMNKLKHFQFPKARFQRKRINGFYVIDDAYNANPASMRNAIDAFSNLRTHGRKIAVIGDMLELGQKAGELHRQAGVALGESSIDMLIGVGRLSHLACDVALEQAGLNHKVIYKCDTADQARDILLSLLKKGDFVLLKGSRAMRLEEIF
jgi:UDP-N-acetylmuramoyl-tripeptide--D-alanyl-D-alanine ligase